MNFIVMPKVYALGQSEPFLSILLVYFDLRAHPSTSCSAVPMFAALPTCIKLAMSVAVSVALNTYIMLPLSSKALGSHIMKPGVSLSRLVMTVSPVLMLLVLCAGLAAGDFSAAQAVGVVVTLFSSR